MSDASDGSDPPVPPAYDASSAAQGPSEGVPSAVYRALADQDWSEAAELVETNWGALISYHMHVVRAVADALPESFVEENSRWASIRRYLNRVLLGSRLQGPSYIELYAARRYSGAPIDVLTQVAGASAESRSRGDFEAAGRYVREGIRMAADPNVRVHSASPMLPALLQTLGLSAQLAAHEGLALQAFHRAYSEAIAAGDARTAANASGELALIHTMAGRGHLADEWIQLHLGVTSVGPAMQKLRTTIHLALASRLHDELRFQEAEAELRKTNSDSLREQWPLVLAQRARFDVFADRQDTWKLLSDLDAAAMENQTLSDGAGLTRFSFDYVRAVILSFGGQSEAALTILEACIQDGGSRYMLPRRAAAHYALGDFEAAERDADLIMSTARVWPRSLTEGLVIKAGTALRKAAHDEAVRHFGQAVRLATDNGLLLQLAAIPLDDVTQLTRLTYAGEEVPQALTLLFEHPHVFVPPVMTVEKLTPQERRVLAELAQGRTLGQTAMRLGLSKNTVKVHVRGIYRKLKVATRTEMVSEASRRGLI